MKTSLISAKSFFVIPALLSIFCISLFIFPPYAKADYPLATEYIYEVAENYFTEGDYDSALHEFNKILLLDPNYEGAINYIDRIQSIQQGYPSEQIVGPTLELDTTPILNPVQETRKKSQLIEDALDMAGSVVGVESTDEKTKGSREGVITLALDSLTHSALGIPESRSLKPKPKISSETTVKEEQIKPRTLYLTDELWESQQNTTVELEIDRSLIIEGKVITRFLIQDLDRIEAQRVDRDSIHITAKNFGLTFLHIWDDKGRWTLNISIIPSYIPKPKKRISLEEENPFKLKYTADWQSYHRGSEFHNVERKNLSFNQWVGIEGPTPYGDTDASMRISKFQKEHEITNYTVGLSNGKIWNFRNFNLRGFDFYDSFSSLSFPGELLKGITANAEAFDKNVKYSLFWGSKREGVFGFGVPGVLDDRESYLEGGRLSIFPYKENRLSFNFAKGYGKDRPVYLKDEVYSVDGATAFKDQKFDFEVAHDQDSVAGFLTDRFHLGDWNLGVSFRDIEKDFSTISGSPPDRGEIGGIINADRKLSENIHFSSDIDIFRERYNPNLGKPKELNYDFSSNLGIKLKGFSSLDTSLTYLNEPGLSFPRRYFNLSSTYSTLIGIFKRDLYPYLGFGFSRSRNPLSPASDYDVYKNTGGFRFGLTKNLFYRFNYDYNWLKEKSTHLRSNPLLLENGLDYHLEVMPRFSIDSRILYRDERETELPHSFLSGEDRVEGSIRTNFEFGEYTEFFTEARLRKSWAEISSRQGEAEIDLSCGLRGTWDTFLSWSPQGKIKGVVFKDLNGNSKNDNEPPIEGVKIKVGKKTFTSDKNGLFETTIKGKKVIVSIEEETLPKDYILTTPQSIELEITKQGALLEFGASIFSGVFGVVYYDVDSNGKFDRGTDVPLPSTKLFLDEKAAFTNLEGTYYYRNLSEGKYNLKLDINSLPIEYLPAVPLTKEIELSEGANYQYSFPLKKK